MREAVSMGLKVLERVKHYAWFAFAAFIILEILYFHTQIFTGIFSAGSTMLWLFRGCLTDPTIETRFDTPAWDVDAVEENDNMVIYEEIQVPAGEPIAVVDIA